MSIDSNAPVELWTVAEVAERLKISIFGVRRLQRSRKLPFVKVGGSVRFFQSDVVAFLRKCRLDAID
jgi:excisionase family DNA binding protein